MQRLFQVVGQLATCWLIGSSISQIDSDVYPQATTCETALSHFDMRAEHLKSPPEQLFRGRPTTGSPAG